MENFVKDKYEIRHDFNQQQAMELIDIHGINPKPTGSGLVRDLEEVYINAITTYCWGTCKDCMTPISPKGKYTKVQECPDYDTVFTQEQRDFYVPLMGLIEDYFHCSGVCGNVPTVYYFSSNTE